MGRSTEPDQEFAGFDISDLEDFDDFLQEESHDPEFAHALADAQARAAVLRQLVSWRKACGMTQTHAASMMRTQQSAISELEGGETDPYLSTLQRYARAIGARITVGVVPPDVRHFIGHRPATAHLVTFAGDWTRGACEADYFSAVARSTVEA
jgi:transcriptional regulator with XRE-family HTH domain